VRTHTHTHTHTYTHTCRLFTTHEHIQTRWVSPSPSINMPIVQTDTQGRDGRSRFKFVCFPQFFRQRFQSEKSGEKQPFWTSLACSGLFLFHWKLGCLLEIHRKIIQFMVLFRVACGSRRIKPAAATAHTFICIYTYMYAFTRACICIHVCVYMYMHVHIHYIYICMCVCIYTYIYKCI